MRADGLSDDQVRALLASVQVFAVAGISANAARPSHGVAKFLQSKGYDIRPVNPGLAGQTLLDEMVFAALADVPGPVDVVDIFRNSEAALGVVREAIAQKDRLGLKAVWMQLDVINEAAVAEARAAGLIAVMDRCPAIEIPRLSR